MNIARAFNQAFGKRMSIADLDRVMDMMVGGGPQTWSGNKVDENSSLTNPTVLACTRVISEAYASMPQHVYRRTSNGGKEIARNHYLYSVLHDEANPELSAFNFREIGQAHLCTWGNHYSLIEYDNASRVSALWPLPPDRVRVKREKINSPRTYWYRQNTGEWTPIASEYMLHVPGMGYDGIQGYSPIGLLRQTIGAADAVAEFGSRFFSNGVRNSGFLETPGTLTKEGAERLSDSFANKYAGLSNAHRIILLEQGLTFKPNSINPDDAQFLETAKLARSVIAGAFRVAAHLIGDLERSTNNNIEQQALEFVTFTMVPWLTRWEAALERTLLTPQGRAQYFIESDTNGVMRGDAASRAAFYQMGINAGWLKPNEARGKENMQLDPAGDVFYRPLNTAFVAPDGTVQMISAPGATPTDKPAPAAKDKVQ